MKHKRIQVRQAEKYRVRCADGHTMPFPKGAKAAKGSIWPAIFTPETVVVLLDSDIVRRRIGAGDLVLCNEKGVPDAVTRMKGAPKLEKPKADKKKGS